jgi:hypothetical protein
MMSHKFKKKEKTWNLKGKEVYTVFFQKVVCISSASKNLDICVKFYVLLFPKSIKVSSKVDLNTATNVTVYSFPRK